MQKHELTELIMAQTPNIAYISDLDTYELYYINNAIVQLLGAADADSFMGKKCYEVLQGKQEPCEFCNNHLLSQDEFYNWIHYNPLLEKYFSLRDKIITLPNGKLARLEIGDDITSTYSILTQEKVLNFCISSLHNGKDPQETIQTLLESLAEYYNAERGYIFKFSKDFSTISNTHEWCAEGVTAEINNLQNLPADCVSSWLIRFDNEGEFYIDSLHDDINPSSPDYAILEAQGITSLVTAPIRDANKNIIGFIGVDNPKKNIELTELIRSVTQFIVDFLDKTELFEELHRLSYTDDLTGVKNRRLFTKKLEIFDDETLNSIGIIYLDINGLKNINDSKGQSFGDAILISLVAILNQCFKDFVYRLGGDEFVIMAENITKKDFEKKVTQITEAINSNSYLSVSIGHAWTDNCINIREDIDIADGMKFLHKQKYYKYSATSSKYYSVLLAKLKSEIENNLFVVYLQPQVDLATLTVVGAEALVRKFDEEGKLIPPDSFISLYEQVGLIDHVDLFVFEEVCKILKSWQEGDHHDYVKDMQISVNFSRQSLLRENLVPYLCELCAKYNVSKDLIIVEITESMDNLDKMQQLQIISEFVNNGFAVSLDDFGSGYSNLSLLAEANFIEVKLDKSLIDTLIESDKTRSLVKSILAVCSELGIPLSIAEGIETVEQYEIVKSFNCHKGQGYLFSRPIPVHEFVGRYILTDNNVHLP